MWENALAPPPASTSPSDLPASRSANARSPSACAPGSTTVSCQASVVATHATRRSGLTGPPSRTTGVPRAAPGRGVTRRSRRRAARSEAPSAAILWRSSGRRSAMYQRRTADGGLTHWCTIRSSGKLRAMWSTGDVLTNPITGERIEVRAAERHRLADRRGRPERAQDDERRDHRPELEVLHRGAERSLADAGEEAPVTRWWPADSITCRSIATSGQA